MQAYRWDEVEKERLSDALSRQMIHGDTMTVARIDLKKGAVVPEHSHHNEQISRWSVARSGSCWRASRGS